MSLLTVVNDVCAVVGVRQTTSVVGGIAFDRTMLEMFSLANEMAQRIAIDNHDWTRLRKSQLFIGDGVTEAFPLPADYARFLLTSQVWRSTSAITPMRFIADTDQWFQRRTANYSAPWGEWTIFGGQIHIWPIMAGPVAPWQNAKSYLVNDLAYDAGPPTLVWKVAVAHTSAAAGTFAADRAAFPGNWSNTGSTQIAPVTARVTYLSKNCVALAAGSGPAFIADTDTFVLDERLLKLGMVFQWKANKGSPYAEDMGNYQDALSFAMGKDEPAPILIGRLPVSQANMAYPFPVPDGMTPL